MTTIREHLRLHQKATDTNDSMMLNLVCQWIDDCGPDLIETDTLIDFVQENLERGPGDTLPPQSNNDPRFNEDDHRAMWEYALEEANDLNTKDIAHLLLNTWDLVSCITSCAVINGQHSAEPLAEMLQHLDNEEEDYVNGDFLREHDDGDGYPAMLNFAKRMGLINDDETELTDLGREFVSTHL